ncbi:MAG: TerB N-terminal domain-containing protein, partial [Cyanobacteria bacterium NC_groundwater_1444_Ag_S-0.65um_54_12]|nr:TerB N-terminal domain-containing protein [Cyanobacteria bacterium NC_groundwater_1444_Ag_S-0.65um_54_12]
MGFYLRKSVSVGPFRFNFSKSGTGVSIGVRGLRVGAGPRGSYVHVGQDGVYYRATLSVRQKAPFTSSVEPLPPDSFHDDLVPIDTGNVLAMQDSSSVELLNEIRRVHQLKTLTWPVAVAAIAVILGVHYQSNSEPLTACMLVIAAIVVALALYRDRISHSIVLFYDLGPAAEQAYDQLHSAADSLANCSRIWVQTASGAVSDWKQNAGASENVRRSMALVGKNAPAILKTNIAVPFLRAAGKELFFFPDRILVVEGTTVGALDYASLQIDRSDVRFIEEDGVPADAKVVDHRWRFVNKDGSRDKRFKDNRQLPIALYEQVRLASPTGLNLVIQCSRLGASETLDSALKAMSSLESRERGPELPALTSEPKAIRQPLPPAPEQPSSQPPARASMPPAPQPPPRQFVPSQASAKPTQSGFWHPAGTPAKVGPYSIPDGMVYVGSALKAPAGHGIEAALIDPSLEVNAEQADHSGQGMSYWPTYSGISPESRAAYLHWLAGGRTDPAAYIGYVFLFFYGLERRILFEYEESAVERPALIAEVERLRNLYPRSHSFQGYVRRLIDFVSEPSPRDISLEEPPARPDRRGGPSVGFEDALLGFARKGKPLPADWAFAWLWGDYGTYLRTPAIRCEKEFEELFKIGYAAQFGPGLELKAIDLGEQTIAYQAASPSLLTGVDIKVTKRGGMVVSNAEAALGQIRKLADACTEDLASYSRLLGRSPGASGSVTVAALPAPLAAKTPLGADLKRWLDASVSAAAPLLIECAELLGKAGQRPDAKPTKTLYDSLAVLLGKLGYGLTPDTRGNEPLPDTKGRVALFRAESQVWQPSDRYLTTSLFVQLGAALAASDAVTEAEHSNLSDVVAKAEVASDERSRLKALVACQLASPPSLTGIKKRLEAVPSEQRLLLKHHLLAVAGADGKISPQEIKFLAKVYPMLGFDQALVYEDLHAIGSAARADVEPVTVVAGGPATPQFKIPAPPREEMGFKLDLARVQAK